MTTKNVVLLKHKTKANVGKIAITRHQSHEEYFEAGRTQWKPSDTWNAGWQKHGRDLGYENWEQVSRNDMEFIKTVIPYVKSKDDRAIRLKFIEYYELLGWTLTNKVR